MGIRIRKNNMVYTYMGVMMEDKRGKKNVFMS